MSLFLPKLQSKFAEFLQRSYLERLSLLDSSTCVGLGYGNYLKIISCKIFSTTQIHLMSIGTRITILVIFKSM